MKKNQEIILSKKELPKGHNEYKIINSDVTATYENLYAVCTPVKIK
ncbi:hypothetical protein QA612_19800 [Evansella sp. AB-P1]|nr:hypothetical protein [Evansella sp. AB-P1]MDG5789705.1 hypothetical protein [Evansella sp. AB-P1]